MKEKYKIILTCYDPNAEPYCDEIDGMFDSITEAQNAMYRCAISEADSLNIPCEGNCKIEKMYGVTLDEYSNPVVYVRYANDNDITKLTNYSVVKIEQELSMLDKYNEMLRERHGKNITVEIKSYIEDDGSKWFYYTSSRYGDSDAYKTIEEAYDEADTYLGELW